jgi:hypothetical protein
MATKEEIYTLQQQVRENESKPDEAQLKAKQAASQTQALELQMQTVTHEAEAACEALATIMDALSIVKAELEAVRTEQERDSKEKSAETERMGTVITGLRDEVSVLEATRVALQIAFTTLESELEAAREALTLAALERAGLDQELQQYSQDLSTLKREVEDIRKELTLAVFEANERSNSSAFKVREMIHELNEAHKDARVANEDVLPLMVVQNKVLEMMEVSHKAEQQAPGDLEAAAGTLFLDGVVFDAEGEWSSVNNKIWVPSADKGEPQAARGRCASLPSGLCPRSPPRNLGIACHHASSTVRLTGHEMQMLGIASKDAEIKDLQKQLKEAADIIKSRAETISAWNAQKECTPSQSLTRDAEVKAFTASINKLEMEHAIQLGTAKDKLSDLEKWTRHGLVDLKVLAEKHATSSDDSHHLRMQLDELRKIHEPCGLHSLRSGAALAARDAQIMGLKADLAALNNDLDGDRQRQLETRVKLVDAGPTKDKDGRVKLGAAPTRGDALLVPLASGGAQDAFEFALQAKANEVEDLQTQLVAVTQKHKDKLAVVKVLIPVYPFLSFSITGYITLSLPCFPHSLPLSFTLSLCPSSITRSASLSLSFFLSLSLSLFLSLARALSPSLSRSLSLSLSLARALSLPLSLPLSLHPNPLLSTSLSLHASIFIDPQKLLNLVPSRSCCGSPHA